MEIPYLIQRAKFQNREDKKGIDSILSFDYMGSAEFEWGALPKSLDRIRKEINDYIYLDVSVQDKVISVCCKNSEKTNIKTYLEQLADNTHHLKEFSAFNSYIKDDGYFKDRFDFWWDILNDVFFWKKNQNFEITFKKELEQK